MSRRHRFLDDLPPGTVDLLPVPYRAIHSVAAGQRVARLAESRFYRAAAFECVGFHRPISKLLRREEALGSGGVAEDREPSGEPTE